MGITAIVKPTHNCNLKCNYCYIPETAEQGVMSEKTLENTIIKVTLFNGKNNETHFIWHGGEPLLMGISFFEKIVAIEKPLNEKGYRITNSIQTNGTLIDENFLDFCEINMDFQIGISLDGPKQINDVVRPYKDGKGSFDDVFKAVKLIQQRNKKMKTNGKKANLGGGAICILNKLNLRKIEELYRFFHNENISININPLIRSGKALKKYDVISLSPEEYGTAMIELFDMWFYGHEQRISLNPFELMMGNVLTKIPYGCQFGESCQKYFISIGPTGAMYPCGRYDGLSEFYLGNINKNTLEEVENNPIRRKLKKRGCESIEECKQCKYKTICNSGCMHNAYMVEGNIMNKDYYCSGYKMIFQHIEEVLHRELEKSEAKA